jgi:hypothetical protein
MLFQIQKNNYFFSHARTALKFGLKSLNFAPNDILLLPEFICSVLIDPINSLGIKIIYYPIEKNLEPNWVILEQITNTHCAKGILMVHYFGIPQNIKKFQDLCLRKKLFLIEDNAHGFGNKLNSKLLGTYGDIGISSPRKILNSKFGGILHLNNKKFIITESFQNIGIINNNFILFKLKYILKTNFPNHINILKKIIYKIPPYDNPLSFQEDQVSDYRLNDSFARKIMQFEFTLKSQKNINNYNSWKNLLLKYNYFELFKNIPVGLSPYCFAFYANNKEDACRFFKWGWDNGYYIYSWPSLPVEVIDNKISALQIWERLVCISLDSPAPKEFKYFHQ